MSSYNYSDSWEILTHDLHKIGAMMGVVDHEKSIILMKFTRNELQRKIQNSMPALDVLRAVVYLQELEAATDFKYLADVTNITITHKFMEEGVAKSIIYTGCYLRAIPKEYRIDNLAVHDNLEFFYEKREEIK